MPAESIQQMFGPILIGVLLSMVLQGVLLFQMYSYYLRYKDSDTWLIKSLILYLLFTETINCGFSIWVVYEPLISKFGDPSVTSVYPMGLAAEPIIMVAISTPIQIFMARRIVKLQKSLWVGGCIVFLATVSLVGGAMCSYLTHRIETFSRTPYLTIFIYVWLIAAAAADVIIAGSLAYSLWKKKTGLKTTDAVLSKIIFFPVKTVVMSSIVAVLNVVTLSAFPVYNASNFVFNIVLMKLYGIFLLATLNARLVWSHGFKFARHDISLVYHEPGVAADVPPIQFHRDPASSNISPPFVPNRKDATLNMPESAMLAPKHRTIEKIV